MWGPHFQPLPLLAVACYVAITGDWSSSLVQVSASPLVGLIGDLWHNSQLWSQLESSSATMFSSFLQLWFHPAK